MKWASWVLVLTFVFSAAWFKYTSPIHSVIIEIEELPTGKNLVDQKDVEQVLMADFKTNFIGWTIRELNPEIIEESIARNPFIKEAHVYVDALNRLYIVIQQREPVLRVQDENQMSFYLDTEGYRMPLSRHYTARVKVATGFIPRFRGANLTHADSLYTALFDVSESISSDPFYEAMVEQIYVGRKGEIYISPKIGDQKVLIGEARDVEEKLDKLKIFMRDGLAYEGWKACDMIDLRFENQIVCTKADAKYSHKTH